MRRFIGTNPEPILYSHCTIPVFTISSQRNSQVVISGTNQILTDIGIPHKMRTDNAPPAIYSRSSPRRWFSSMLELPHFHPGLTEPLSSSCGTWGKIWELLTSKIRAGRQHCMRSCVLSRNSTQDCQRATCISAFPWETLPHQISGCWATDLACQRTRKAKHRHNK